MMLSHRNLFVITALLIVFITIYFYTNPLGLFGLRCFGFTVYNSIPIPLLDIQVNAEGKMRIIGKTHTLTIDKIKWLIKPLPEVLIISSGWDNAVKVDEEIEKMKGCEVRILTTAKAMSLYNKLKKSGVRAAIHVHSTC